MTTSNSNRIKASLAVVLCLLFSQMLSAGKPAVTTILFPDAMQAADCTMFPCSNRYDNAQQEDLVLDLVVDTVVEVREEDNTLVGTSNASTVERMDSTNGTNGSWIGSVWRNAAEFAAGTGVGMVVDTAIDRAREWSADTLASFNLGLPTYPTPAYNVARVVHPTTVWSATKLGRNIFGKVGGW